MNRSKIITSLDEAKSVITLPELAVEHWETELADIKIIQPEVVEVSGNKYSVTASGVKSLCTILGIPPAFYKALHSEDEQLWEHLTSRIEENRNINTRFSTRKGNITDSIIGFNKASAPWISNEAFLDIVAYELQHHPELELKAFRLWDSGAEAQLVFKDKEISILAKATDIFKLGLSMFNSEIVDFRTGARFSLERMFCSNRASMVEKEIQWLATHRGSSENLIQYFYSNLNNMIQRSDISLEKFIRERVDVMTQVNASLKELETAYELGLTLIDRLPDRMSDYDRRIPLKEVAKRYNLEYPIAKKKSDKWKSTASTPVKLYDLYNEITWIASNAPELQDFERFSMEIEIGKAFLSQQRLPDGLDIAPIVSWN